MKSDIQVMKGAHNQEVKRFQGDLESIKTENNQLKLELDDSRAQNMDLGANNKALNDELERYQHMQEETAIDVSYHVFV